MGLATTAAIIGIGLGFGANKLLSKSQQQPQSPIPLPKPPSVDASAAKAENIVRAKRATQSQTIHSSPLGLAGEAQVARKTLLGQ